MKKKTAGNKSLICPELLADLNTLLAIRASDYNHPQLREMNDIRKRIHTNMPEEFIDLLSMLIGSGYVETVIRGCHEPVVLNELVTGVKKNVDGGIWLTMGSEESLASVEVYEREGEIRSKELEKFLNHIGPWWADVSVTDLEEKEKKAKKKAKKKTAKKKTAKKKTAKKKEKRA